jgi:hypothetical protein
LPSQAHDVRMDDALTPAGLVVLDGAGGASR